jgi:hypothetical protein
MEAGLLPYILGRDCADHISGEELERLARLAAAIHLSAPDPAFRIALFYQCFEEERALCAIDFLGYSNEMKKLLGFAVTLFAEMDSISDKVDLKRFLVKTGLAHYRYLTELAEQRSKISARGWESGVRRRRGPGSCVRDFAGEPRFSEKYRTTGTRFPEGSRRKRHDLIGLGISEGERSQTRILLDTVHRFRRKTDKCMLSAWRESSLKK